MQSLPERGEVCLQYRLCQEPERSEIAANKGSPTSNQKGRARGGSRKEHRKTAMGSGSKQTVVSLY